VKWASGLPHSLGLRTGAIPVSVEASDCLIVVTDRQDAIYVYIYIYAFPTPATCFSHRGV
jgi:hypothetical protein